MPSEINPGLFMSLTDEEGASPIEVVGRQWPRLKFSDYLTIENSLKNKRREHVKAIAKDAAMSAADMAVFLYRNDPFDASLLEVDKWMDTADGCRAVLVKSLSLSGVKDVEAITAIDAVPPRCAPGLARLVLGFIVAKGDSDPKASGTGDTGSKSSPTFFPDATPTA